MQYNVIYYYNRFIIIIKEKSAVLRLPEQFPVLTQYSRF